MSVIRKVAAQTAMRPPMDL